MTKEKKKQFFFYYLQQITAIHYAVLLELILNIKSRDANASFFHFSSFAELIDHSWERISRTAGCLSVSLRLSDNFLTAASATNRRGVLLRESHALTISAAVPWSLLRESQNIMQWLECRVLLSHLNTLWQAFTGFFFITIFFSLAGFCDVSMLSEHNYNLWHSWHNPF